MFINTRHFLIPTKPQCLLYTYFYAHLLHVSVFIIFVYITNIFPNILSRTQLRNSRKLLCLKLLLANRAIKVTVTKLGSNVVPYNNIMYCYTFLLLTSFTQQLDDALNINLCGHFLISLVAMCFVAFSAVAVQYMNCCML